MNSTLEALEEEDCLVTLDLACLAPLAACATLGKVGFFDPPAMAATTLHLACLEALTPATVPVCTKMRQGQAGKWRWTSQFNFKMHTHFLGLCYKARHWAYDPLVAVASIKGSMIVY